MDFVQDDLLVICSVRLVICMGGKGVQVYNKLVTHTHATGGISLSSPETKDGKRL